MKNIPLKMKLDFCPRQVIADVKGHEISNQMDQMLQMEFCHLVIVDVLSLERFLGSWVERVTRHPFFSRL